MRQATLCLLMRGDEILLAMKKKGFGIGKWNGVGGKFDPNFDKDIDDTALREIEEEIGAKAIKIEKTGIFSFYFPNKKEWNQDVHLYLVNSWEGEPKESDEVCPKWFNKNNLPFDKMWDDDKIWLPKILEGKKIRGIFTFNQDGNKIENYSLENLK